MALSVESSAVDKGGDFRNVFTTNTAGTALSTSGALQVANIVTGFEFAGSQNVNIVLAKVATANDFCLVGSNTNFAPVPADGWWTYSKGKGGLQSIVGTSLVDATTRC